MTGYRVVGGGSSANVQWGPDFGEGAGSDNNTFTAGVNVTMPSLALEHEKNVGVNVTMPSLALEHEKNVGVNLDLDALALDHTKNIGVNVDLDALAAVYNEKQVGVNVTMPSLALEHTKSVGVNADLDSLALSHTKSVGVDVSEATVVITGMSSDEDTYLERDNPNTTHGADAILFAKNNTAVVNDDNKAYVAWDLTGVLGNTVNAATIHLRLAEDVAVGGADFTIQVYTNAAKPFEEDNATWNNDEPPPGVLRQTFTVTINGSATHDLVLNAAVRGNMLGNWVYVRGVGTADGLGVNSMSIESKEAANPANRPTMDMTIALTV